MSVRNLNFEDISNKIFELVNECRSNPSNVIETITSRLNSFEGKNFIASGIKF